METKHPAANDASQYLAFRLSNEFFAIHIKNIREVLEYTKITEVPQAPRFMSGIINLRGTVVPLVDMRLKIGVDEAEITLDTCIIIVETIQEQQIHLIGILVDAVQEVVSFSAADIQSPPQAGTKLRAEFIQGIGRYNNNLVIILDTQTVLSLKELTSPVK